MLSIEARKVKRWQKEYLKAKEIMEKTVQDAIDAELDFVHERNIVNSDGSVPKCLWEIEDTDVFRAAEREFRTDPRNHRELVNNVKYDFYRAGDILIDSVLWTYPQDLQTDVKRAMKTGGKRVREQVLELCLRLDADTIPIIPGLRLDNSALSSLLSNK